MCNVHNEQVYSVKIILLKTIVECGTVYIIVHTFTRDLKSGLEWVEWIWVCLILLGKSVPHLCVLILFLHPWLWSPHHFMKWNGVLSDDNATYGQSCLFNVRWYKRENHDSCVRGWGLTRKVLEEHYIQIIVKNQRAKQTPKHRSRVKIKVLARLTSCHLSSSSTSARLPVVWAAWSRLMALRETTKKKNSLKSGLSLIFLIFKSLWLLQLKWV